MTSVYYFNRARGKLYNKLNWGELLSVTLTEDITSASVTENTKGKGTGLE